MVFVKGFRRNDLHRQEIWTLGERNVKDTALMISNRLPDRASLENSISLPDQRHLLALHFFDLFWRSQKSLLFTLAFTVKTERDKQCQQHKRKHGQQPDGQP